jgi:hypothetical protein
MHVLGSGTAINSIMLLAGYTTLIVCVQQYVANRKEEHGEQHRYMFYLLLRTIKWTVK